MTTAPGRTCGSVDDCPPGHTCGSVDKVPVSKPKGVRGEIMAEQKDIGIIDKGANSKVVVSITTYRKQLYFDIREHIKTDTYDGPTKKGIRLPAEQFAEFKELMSQLEKEIKKHE